MSLQLIVTLGPDMGRDFSFESEREVIIGRGDDCDVQLEDPKISRNHCRIVFEKGRALLEDLNSSWGTSVNEARINAHQLQPGDLLQLGETKLRFEVKSNASDVTWAPNASTADRSSAANLAKPASQPSPGEEEITGPPQVESPQARAIPSSMQNAMDSANSAEPILLRAAASEPTDHSRQGPPHPADSLDHLIGKTLHKYRIIKQLTQTATGTLFLAHDTKKSRKVALKVLWPFLSKQDEDVQRFVRSIEAMRGIKHPNLIAQYGAGITKPHCWVATELVEGASLAEQIAQGPQPWRKVARMVSEIAQALVVAAENDVLHRNITPASIRIRNDGVAKLGDLILATALQGTQAERLTKPGETVGELPYLAPESLFDEPLDIRSDIYSLGITAYTAITGKNPFMGKNISETLANVINVKPPALRLVDPEISVTFEKLLFRMISSQVFDRPASPGDIVQQMTFVVAN